MNKMLKNIMTIRISILIVLLYVAIYSETPFFIVYQGFLTDSTGNPRPDGEYQILFEIFLDSSGGSRFWSQTKELPIHKGAFETAFGRDSLNGFPYPFLKEYWLSVSVDNKVLHPRIQLSGITQIIRPDTGSVANLKNTFTAINAELVRIIQVQQQEIDRLASFYLELETLIHPHR